MAQNKTITYDDTRDVSIRIVEYLIDNKIITEFEDENQWDFHIQDLIEMLGMEMDETEVVEVKPIEDDQKKIEKEFTFSVPCSLEYRIFAHNEEEAKNILIEKGGYEIQGEISVEGSDYDNAILI